MTVHALRAEPLQCRVEAARFATTREDAEARVALMRANGINRALYLLRTGHPGAAHTAVMRSFFDQARALGLHLHQTERGSW